ncbi:uncharacterized protein B0T15DRAFT_533946 [Chaetomium strumarium]|uniref:Uncharacterized protein n=1 Tax=Chaetomium strumarium TaxID=1170767 RepID=A0AAJ0M1W9_9PEZI|nr:hypothetical protein B0T15DRAFT_533946 [Chaetomium strumarium]
MAHDPSTSTIPQFSTASVLVNIPNPEPTELRVSEAPHDTSAFVILAAALGSLALGLFFLCLAKCAFANPVLRQIRRQRRAQAPGHILPVSTTPSSSDVTPLDLNEENSGTSTGEDCPVYPTRVWIPERLLRIYFGRIPCRVTVKVRHVDEIQRP